MSKRITNEVKKLRESFPGEFSILLDEESFEMEISRFVDGEELIRCKILFGSEYPYKPPQVYLLYLNIPISENVCRSEDGRLCDCTLKTEWSPQCTVYGVIMGLYDWLKNAHLLTKRCDFLSPIPGVEPAITINKKL